MATVQVSPAVLKWAAIQAGRSVEEIAGLVSPRDMQKILAGGLTEAQAIRFSKLTTVPLGLLFLPKPPSARETPIADFRTPAEREPLGREFFEVFDDIALKQDWYREYLLANEVAPVSFIGKFARNKASDETIAASIRERLGISRADREAVATPEQHFALLAAKSEEAGILVFKNSVVGNNTRRHLSERQFRGFAIADDLAPVIFVNGADAPNAWVFTLAHELAHLWLGESGISDVRHNSVVASERRCNRIAAEFLLPRAEFIEAWSSAPGSPTDRVDLLRRRFCVSSLVVAFRASDLDLADASVAAPFLAAGKAPKKKGKGGGDFYATLAVRNSKRFSSRVAGLAVSGAITFKEAGRLLNVNVNSVAEFHARLG